MNIINTIIVVEGIVLIILLLLLKLTKVPSQVYKNKVLYSDHNKEKPKKALYSPKYRLIGKPDFILHTKDGLLPLEIKHTNRPKQPYFSHVMQLISYCLLMEEEKGIKPKYGFIQYKEGQAFSISYTEKRKSCLLKIMQEMRSYMDSCEGPKPVKVHKCEKCNYRDDCFSG